jgi:hypothetical protein
MSIATPSASVTGSPVSAAVAPSSRWAMSVAARTHSSQPGGETPPRRGGRQPGRGAAVERAQSRSSFMRGTAHRERFALGVVES